MKFDRACWIVVASAVAMIGIAREAEGQERSYVAPAAADDLSGPDDFDFLAGKWRVHHWMRPPGESGDWSEFEGACTNRALIGRLGNLEEHQFQRPAGVTYGIVIRTFDPATARWAIWWIDSEAPHDTLDPPMIGAFEDGVGTFYSDRTLDGKPVRVRFIWSQIKADSARWERAYSWDGGTNWQTNWIMQYERDSSS